MCISPPTARAPRRDRAARSPGRALAPLATALALALLVPSAHADDPARRHAVWGPTLAAQEAAEAQTQLELGLADAAARRAGQGLGARLEAVPSATWSGGPGRAGSLGSGVVVTGRLDWSDDPAARASALLARHRTYVGQVEAAHRAVRATLGAYLELRRAHIAVAQAEAATATRRATFARAEASVLGREGPEPRPGSASDVELEVARLELERALVSVERAARDLASAERRAAALGIDTAAAERAHLRVEEMDPLEGWRLVAPPAEQESTLVERRRLERALALARLDRRGEWSALDDVRIEGVLTGRDARVRLGLELDEGRPGAFVEGSVRDAARASWSVSVRARVRIDDTWSADRASAERAMAAADEALAEALDEERWAAAEALQALHDAEDDVVFAERVLELGRAALRALDEERVAIAAAARAGDERDAARLRRFDDAYARSLLGHLRERDAFLRAWSAYARAAERAAIRVAGAFAVRAPPEAVER